MRYKIIVGGVIGVPNTFLRYHDPQQFQILNQIDRYAHIDDEMANPKGTYGTSINGECRFSRILIRRVP